MKNFLSEMFDVITALQFCNELTLNFFDDPFHWTTLEQLLTGNITRTDFARKVVSKC